MSSMLDSAPRNALLLLLPLLSGCVFDLDRRPRPGEDAAADLPVRPDRPFEGRREAGRESGPDAPAPDRPVDSDHDNIPDELDPEPDRPNDVLYNGTPGDHLADFDGGVPPAVSRGTDLCMESFGVMSNALKGVMLLKDYVVMTRFTVHATAPSGDPVAGVGLRLTPGDGYRCLVDLDDEELLIRARAGPGWEQVGETAAITAAPSYRLVGRAVGDRLECKLWGSTPGVAATLGSQKAGTVGLVAIDAKVCFHSFLVVTSGP